VLDCAAVVSGRVAARPILQLSNILQVPVLFFFEAMPHAPAGSDEGEPGRKSWG
jgi:hypothetical protein